MHLHSSRAPGAARRDDAILKASTKRDNGLQEKLIQEYNSFAGFLYAETAFNTQLMDGCSRGDERGSVVALPQ
jgi:hypothetical protein